ncbi:copper-binding protein [Phytohalomonas tamaricis]|uniref:copper-binding protein n=1 Tax=Phytohalomonas tamaricis TaxID=2081032 RepID=UPI001319D33D|nr:copper-binding protein [Phytohalomonas tamaricis]
MNKLIRPLLTAATLVLATQTLPVMAAEMQDMDMKASSQQSQAETVQASGVVKGIDLQAQKITLAHSPIKALNWPAMKMAFKVAEPTLLEGINVGDKVQFELQGADHVVTALETDA